MIARLARLFRSEVSDVPVTAAPALFAGPGPFGGPLAPALRFLLGEDVGSARLSAVVLVVYFAAAVAVVFAVLAPF